MLRLMLRPMPMPSGLVVQNASNRCACASADRPPPQSATVSRSERASSGAVPIRISRACAGVRAIASIAFNNRLTSTCWTCTRSASTSGNAGASAIRSAMALCSSSLRASASTSSTAALRSNALLRGASPLLRLRIRAITSLARLPSSRIRCSAACARSRFGGCWPSQRWQALPLVTMAASGWLTSCAIEAVRPPRLRARASRSSCACAACAAALACSICTAMEVVTATTTMLMTELITPTRYAPAELSWKLSTIRAMQAPASNSMPARVSSRTANRITTV